jgi:hypothetical protein
MCVIFENVEICGTESKTVLREVFGIVKACICGLWEFTPRNALKSRNLNIRRRFSGVKIDPAICTAHPLSLH